MRDPNRIRPFCNILAAAWEQYPDLRFGQLISNVIGNYQFYMEDDEALERLKLVLKDGLR